MDAVGLLPGSFISGERAPFYFWAGDRKGKILLLKQREIFFSEKGIEDHSKM
jgi:hypothetical protein